MSMRSARLFGALLAFFLVASIVATVGPTAHAQSVTDAEEDAADAERRANQADGLVDDAVANRTEIEVELAESISRMNELAAQLSIIGNDLDEVASQVGYADVELAGIQSDIENQAVDAYMTVVSSPTVSVVNTGTVERALVASSVVEDVVADGRLTVDELFAKRKSLENLKQTYLDDQAEYARLKEEIDAEVARYTDLYEEADAAVAEAIRDAEEAERDYLAALSAVEVAKAREEERRRQQNRNTTTTSPPATQPSSPPTSGGGGGGTSPPTTSPPNTTTSTSGGGGGPWNHPPAVEQWRPLVQQYFPSHRVEEALRIIDCESNGDPNAVNPYSGASGLFQFLPSTWASSAPKAGFGGASPFEPEPNVGSAAWLANRYEQLGLYYWQAWSCRRVLN